MISRTICNLKTLQILPKLTSQYLKGLLTYRTIQFSMSSRCFHPKSQSLEATKNPRADSLSNSASQSFVNFADTLWSRLELSTVFFRWFSSSIPFERTRRDYLNPTTVQVLFPFLLSYFSTSSKPSVQALNTALL